MTDSPQARRPASPGGAEQRREADTISLLDLVGVLVKRRFLILGTTLTAAVLVFAFALMTARLPQSSPWNLMPNYYRAEAKILLQENGSGVAQGIATSDNALTLLLGGARGKDSNIVLAQAILSGNTLKDTVAEEFDFYDRFNLNQSSHPKTSARSMIGDSLAVDLGQDQGGNIFTVTYQDNDPVFAYQVLSRITGLLEARFKELTLERLTRKKAFVEERMAAVEGQVQEAQSRLSEFQARYGVLDITRQAEQQGTLIAGLRSDVLKAQMELQSLREYLPEGDARITRLKQEIENKNRFIDDLLTGKRQLSEDYIPQKVLPELLAQYMDLQNEVDVQQAVYRSLRQQYESVKIEEADNSRTFQVLERPEVPELKAGPSRSKLCIIVTIAAFFLAVLLAFVKEYLVRVRRDPEESEKLESIRRMLLPRRGNKRSTRSE